MKSLGQIWSDRALAVQLSSGRGRALDQKRWKRSESRKLKQNRLPAKSMFTNKFFCLWKQIVFPFQLAVNISDRIRHNGDAEEEDNDKVGESQFMKRTKSTRSSTLLHSVEDLSTDSTCVYKARSGYDSRRNSSRCHQAGNAVDATNKSGSGLNTDELLEKVALNSPYTRKINSTKQSTTNRGLSKSMILPTSTCDYSDLDGSIKIKRRKSCCDRIKRFATDKRHTKNIFW